jgi:hypothetical protein
MNLPVDLMFPVKKRGEITEIGGTPCGPGYVEWVKRSLASAHDFARKHLKMAAIRQKRNYDKRSKFLPIVKVGDLVRYKRPALQVANKFNLPWVGPYKVTKLVGEIDVEIAFWRGEKAVGRKVVVHINDVKPYGRINTSSDEEEPVIDVLGELPTVKLPEKVDAEPSQDTSTGTEGMLEVPLRRSLRLKRKAADAK